MARKTRSTKREGEHPPALPSPAPVSVEEAGRLHERAVTLREEGQHAEAATCARHALIFFARVCGPEHHDVAMTLSNLAVLYKSLGRYADAEALYQRALPLFERTLGPTHPHVETCLRNYARLLRETQRQAEARPLVARARQARIAAARTPEHGRCGMPWPPHPRARRFRPLSLRLSKVGFW